MGGGCRSNPFVPGPLVTLELGIPGGSTPGANGVGIGVAVIPTASGAAAQPELPGAEAKRHNKTSVEILKESPLLDFPARWEGGRLSVFC